MDISDELSAIEEIEASRKTRANVWAPQPDELKLLCQPTEASSSKKAVVFIGYNWGGPGRGKTFPAWERPGSSALVVEEKAIWNPESFYDRNAGYVTGVFDSTEQDHAVKERGRTLTGRVYRADCILWPSTDVNALEAIKREEPDIWQKMESVSLRVLEKKLQLAGAAILVVSGGKTQKILQSIGSSRHGAVNCYNLGKRLATFPVGGSVQEYLWGLRTKVEGMQ